MHFLRVNNVKIDMNPKTICIPSDYGESILQVLTRRFFNATACKISDAEASQLLEMHVIVANPQNNNIIGSKVGALGAEIGQVRITVT